MSHLKSKNDAAYAPKSHTHSYLPLSGGTLTGSLTGTSSYFTETTRSRHEYRNVIEYDSSSICDEIVIKTSIPFANSNSMIPVHIKGYAYGSAAPVDLTVAFYIFDNVFNSYGCISSGAWKPTIYLSTYTKNSAKYVAISLNKNEYFLRFSVDILDIWTSSYRDAYARGWSIQDQLKGTNSSIIPQTDIVTVPYKNLATDISGNAGAAATADNLTGFIGRRASATWGNQTGTFVTGWDDSTGGSIVFRRDNPSSGKLSCIIDGYFYQNEGNYMCLDTNNYTSYAPTKTGSGASGTWGINVTGSSASCTGNSATATTASGANVLNVNTRMDYGWGGVNYFNFNGTAGAAAKTNDSPTSAYWHILRFNHANSSGYYTDLAIPFNHSSLYYKYVQAGSVAHNRWIKVLDDLNYNDYAPTKTGGGASGTWGINVTGSSASCTGNAATATKADTIKDSYNGNAITVTYGKSGQSSTSWLASWNGYELGSISPANITAGKATTADKLTTARTISLGMYSDGSASFNGSGDITIHDYGYGTSKYVTTDSTATPYWRIAYTSTTSSWNDMDMLIAVSSNYNGGGFGILKVSFRTDSISSGANGSASVRWLARYGYALDQFIVKYYLAQGATCYADLYFKANSSYQDVNVRVLTSGGRGSRSRAWTFDNGASRANPDIRTYTGTSTSVDAGFVLQSSSAVKLATARTIQTNLASTSAVSFSGESNVSPGVTGTLPIANGGTSATTKAGARSNLGITSGTAAPAASGTAGDIYIQYA